jgi:hypothetical protein
MKTRKIKKFQELSNDIKDPEILELEDGIVKSKSSDKFEIESIIDVFMDHKDLPFYEANQIGFSPDLSNREVKRGDTIYITALVKKKGNSFSSPATQAVIKVRVIDIYHGLAYLNKVIK